MSLRLTGIIITLCSALCVSCFNDSSKVTVTYSKKVPIFADLDSIRQTSLSGALRNISRPGKVYVSDDFLLLGEVGEGVHVFDNHDPSNPIAVSFINIPGCKEFFVEKNSLYADSYHDMLKIDISVLREPKLVSRLENVTGNAKDGKLFLEYRSEEVTELLEENEDFFTFRQEEDSTLYSELIPKIAVPTSFTANSNNSPGTMNRMTYYKKNVYVLGYQKLFTFKDDGELTFIKEDFISPMPERMYPYDDKLYISTSFSIEIMDISAPELPKPLASFDHIKALAPVLPQGEVAYLSLHGSYGNNSTNENLFIVLNMTDINDPVREQEFFMKSPFGISIVGDSIYVGEGRQGVTIFYVTDNNSLIFMHSDPSIPAYDVIAHPSRKDVIVTTGPSGLVQFSKRDSPIHELLSKIPF